MSSVCGWAKKKSLLRKEGQQGFTLLSSAQAAMATMVMESIGRVFISRQQIRQVPRLLTEAAPSMPGTVTDSEVPAYFRERYVSTGYRPLEQSWRYYFLSLFQRHNETINVWTHLLAFLLLLVKLRQLADMVDFVNDHHSWPLLILVLSSLTYSGFSVLAHLLGGKSELCHYLFYFLDYVGVAQYQYGSAVVHFYYAVDETMHRSMRGLFMPTATILSCLSCLGCCYGKYCNHTRPCWVRKVCQVVPSALAYMWDSSPVAKRLLLWSNDDLAVAYHFGQVAFFLSCSFFFTFPLLERYLPGRCDFVGQSHQVFHVLLSCCTFCQIHASYLDYVHRGQLYLRLHESDDAALFVGLYVLTLVGCALITAFMLRKVKHVLDFKLKLK
ncbi:membrane progestin receptor alpha-B-like [Xiphophorus maculatus]|uniref:Progestin and adipoQ receptor family member VII, a n=1 Tax=Xiphophorus maculatus TaxID=8083 RepID=M4AC92_XIPMA|nr:membrane progestin receptor alpha-B-like [Xiphophorus maculatus]